MFYYLGYYVLTNICWFSLRNQKCRGLLGLFCNILPLLEICQILHVLRSSQNCESQTGTWPGRKVNVQIDIGKATVAVVLLQMVLYGTLHQIRKKKKLNNVNQDYAQLVPKLKSIRGSWGDRSGSISRVLDPFRASRGPWSQKRGPFWAIFWPSPTPPANPVKIFWSKIGCTAVPHIVLHVSCWTRTTGGYFRPFEVRFRGILALSSDWFYNVKTQKTFYLLRDSAPDFKIYILESFCNLR